ncbi:interleukin-15 receptor subunit alpha isoform X2 [Aquarana catesbeiana]|uniref:interleukin-15 receptor subunit alpha isoform X2 n=1 Tax=Aquarana catesbeiana TaxID=8400 RepID=UPI003CC9798D
MAVALLTTSIHALLLCVLLVLTRQMSTSKTAVPECGALKTVENAEVIPFSEKNLQYIRYRCLGGYKRKAGTSNLAICEFNSTTKKAYWKYGNIACIRDPSLPMTTHSTLTSPTTSDQQHYTAFPTTGESTIYIMDTTSSTTSGSTTVGKVTVGTTTQQPRSSEHAATSRETAQSLPESTYFSTDETPKLSTITYYTTPEHDSTVPDPSLWQQEKTIGSIAGVLLFLTLLVICIVIWIKRRNQHSPVPQEELKQEHDYSADQEEMVEESRNL